VQVVIRASMSLLDRLKKADADDQTGIHSIAIELLLIRRWIG
jgi:hypothetical protein